MNLIKLVVNNFKKHGYLEAEFGERLTVVRGPNWAGKSSFLHAILFALYGPSAVPGKKDGLPKQGGGKLKVELTVSTPSGEASIIRTLTSAVVHDQAGTILASSASAVDHWVQQQLGLDRKTALSIAYSPQSETAALLTLGVPALNRLVEQLSGADVVERMIEKASDRVRRLEAQITSIEPVDYEASLDEDLMLQHRLEERIEIQTYEVENAEKMYAASVKDYNDSCLENQFILQARKDAERAQQQQSQVEALRTSLSELTAWFDSAESVESLNEKVVLCNSVHDVLVAKVESERRAKLEVEKLEKWFATTGANWQKLEANIEKVAKLKSDLPYLMEGLDLTKDAYRDATKIVADLKTMLEGAACPTCKRAFEDHDPAEIEAELQAAEEVFKSARAKYAAAKAALTKVEDEISSLKVPPEDYEEQYNAKVTELEEAQALTVDSSAAAELVTAKAELAQAQKNLNEYKMQQNKLSLMNGQLATAEGALMAPEDLAELAILAAKELIDLDGLTAIIDEETKQVAQARSVLKELDRELVGVKVSISRTEALKAQQEASIASMRQAEIAKATWAKFLAWLRASKSALLADLWDSILGQAGEFLAQATSGYASSLQRSEDGEFSIVEDGREMPASGVSGGMRAIAATALRLALADLVPTAPRWVLLDEASAELNDENAGHLASALSGYDRQVVMVTHRAGEEYLAEQMITLG